MSKRNGGGEEQSPSVALSSKREMKVKPRIHWTKMLHLYACKQLNNNNPSKRGRLGVQRLPLKGSDLWSAIMFDRTLCSAQLSEKPWGGSLTLNGVLTASFCSSARFSVSNCFSLCTTVNIFVSMWYFYLHSQKNVQILSVQCVIWV